MIPKRAMALEDPSIVATDTVIGQPERERLGNFKDVLHGYLIRVIAECCSCYRSDSCVKLV
jgi:hypothetical protein